MTILLMGMQPGQEKEVNLANEDTTWTGSGQQYCQWGCKHYRKLTAILPMGMQPRQEWEAILPMGRQPVQEMVGSLANGDAIRTENG